MDEVGLVVTVKLPLEAPAGITRVEGTNTTPGTPDESFTLQPAEGAGVFKVTVPVELAPAETVEGLNDSPVMESA